MFSFLFIFVAPHLRLHKHFRLLFKSEFHFNVLQKVHLNNESLFFIHFSHFLLLLILIKCIELSLYFKLLIFLFFLLSEHFPDLFFLIVTIFLYFLLFLFVFSLNLLRNFYYFTLSHTLIVEKLHFLANFFRSE